ncbi:MAG: alpha/beta fold hydrolase [Planktotalea sp.]|uniref:alpha/beta fold hydrolase n=1 Tax=Planktotalea sp. TaxID=2029877 RepID=UPI003C74FFCF
MAEFLLVHGSCHGAWCWRDVVPALEGLGHRVRAIDLPSHGADKTPIADVTLDLYRDAILNAIEAPVHLVGHSMAGFPIAAAAQAQPSKIARLIYLCAYAPISGSSLVDMRKMQARQPLLDAIEMSEDRLSWSPKKGLARETFYHDCPDEAVAFAEANIVPQANLPQVTKLALGANYEGVAKSYIRCADDRTIPPEFQTEMAQRIPAIDRHEMQTSHSPFFADPVGLAALLDKIARAR